MLKPRETEHYLPDAIPFIAVSIGKGKLLQAKHIYPISRKKEVDTGTTFALFSDLTSVYFQSKTAQVTTERKEAILTLWRRQYNIDLYQQCYSLAGNSELTFYDRWGIGKSVEFYISAAPVAPKDDLQLLHDVYEFDYSGKEERFLQNNNYLLPFLLEAKDHIKRICASNIKILLQLSQDKEENCEILFIVIKTNLSSDENLNLMDRLDDEWWLDVDYNFRRILSLDVETDAQ